MNSTAKCLCMLLLAARCTTAGAQASNETFYLFKQDWTAASTFNDCTYFMQALKKSDTEYVCRYYPRFGPMIRQESYRDADLSVPNGFFCWYNHAGYMDSSGYVKNGRKDQRWYYYNTDTLQNYYEEYAFGILQKRELIYNKKPLDGEDDDLPAVSQKEASYKGGTWSKYISSNVTTPERFTQNMKPGRYVVTVAFTIGKTGMVQEVMLIKSVEWSVDAKVFRLIENSPAWTSAVQNNEPVLYRQKQNIVFNITD